MKTVRAIATTLIVVTELGHLAAGQEKPKPLTVCEVLADLKHSQGKPVAVVGRLDCPVSLIDQHWYLVEDHCERSFVIRGEAWPNKIWLEWDYGSSGRSLAVEDALIRQKLDLIRKSTTLGFHKALKFSLVGDVCGSQ